LLYNKLCTKKLFPLVILFFLILPFSRLFAQQTLVVKANNQPLNKVITALRDQYDIKLSFNDDKLSQYIININRSFISADEALNFLLKGLPLILEKDNNVFIISTKKAISSNTRYLLSGHVVDGKSNESLPFSSIVVNGYPLTTDLKGNFSYSTVVDSLFKIQVSYLGYYKLDTVVNAANNITVKLFENSINIEEIVLTSRSSDKATIMVL
jgi:hypothetical protein